MKITRRIRFLSETLLKARNKVDCIGNQINYSEKSTRVLSTTIVHVHLLLVKTCKIVRCNQWTDVCVIYKENVKPKSLLQIIAVTVLALFQTPPPPSVSTECGEGLSLATNVVQLVFS